MTAYYNEIDEYAAQWLRNLIAAGHIASGDVDTRSITKVHPDDIKNYNQCHFFAGIGVWSYALRRAGWADSRPVWTGSCPCQPFSIAGKGDGFNDERHLWPVFGNLIREHQPATVFGEQVASKDADAWIDLVQADLEAMGYAFGAVPFPAAGIGAPHIRDRLYWVAYSNGTRGKAGIPTASRGHEGNPREFDNCCCEHACLGQRPSAGRLANTHSDGCESRIIAAEAMGQGNTAVANGGVCGVGDANSCRRQPQQTNIPLNDEGVEQGKRQQICTIEAGGCFPGVIVTTSPTNGFWRDSDWLLCRDGKWRPVEPGTFPLAHGITNRVGRLRAYGNAICAEAAVEFIKIAMEYQP